MVRRLSPVVVAAVVALVPTSACVGEDPQPVAVSADAAPDTGPADAGCSSTCPTEGATRCDGLEVQTCTSQGGCLAWSASAACGGGGICCGTACVPADVANCYQCGVACSGQTPACLPTPKKCGCSVAVCAASSQGCSQTTGACEACVAPVVGAKDFYVDATSFAGATGTESCPFKTIGAALAAISTRGTTDAIVHVAPGTYDAALGETFPLIVRGTSIIGSGSTKTIIKGVSTFDHGALGGAFNASYQLTVLAGDAVGQTTIQGVSIQTTATTVTAQHVGILCDRGNSPQSFGDAIAEGNTILRDVAVGPNYETGVVVSTTSTGMSSGCNLTALGSTFTGNSWGIWALGCGIGAGSVLASVKVGDGTPAGGNTFKDNSPGGGIVAWDCTHGARILNNTFDGNYEGLQLQQNGKATKVVVRSNVISNSRFAGIVLYRQPEIAELVDNVIQGSATQAASPATASDLGAGLRFVANGQPYPTILKARNNRFINNEIGIHFSGAAGSLPTSDFGSAADPGGNELACNSSLHGGVSGGDVIVDTTGSATFPFRGNAWDHATPTTTAADGVDLLTTAGGFTLDVTGSSATTKTTTCAGTHVK
jgi:hypothetical protein